MEHIFFTYGCFFFVWEGFDWLLSWGVDAVWKNLAVAVSGDFGMRWIRELGKMAVQYMQNVSKWWLLLTSFSFGICEIQKSSITCARKGGEFFRGCD